MMVNPDYDPKMSKSDLEDLDIQGPSDLLFYVIVTIDHMELMRSTANLTGPIIVNLRAKRGKQIILDDSKYSIKTPIVAEGGQ